MEKDWRELEEAELKRLEGVKKQLEEEKRVEQQHAEELQGLERVPEWCHCLSRTPPKKPERTTKGADLPPGIVIPEKNCMWCITWGSLCHWYLDGHAWSCWLC